MKYLLLAAALVASGCAHRETAKSGVALGLIGMGVGVATVYKCSQPPHGEAPGDEMVLCPAGVGVGLVGIGVTVFSLVALLIDDLPSQQAVQPPAQ